MKTFVTRQLSIVSPNKSKADKLNLTARRYKQCLNFFMHHHARKVKLDTLYEEAKQLYSLPTGLIQTCRDVAKEQYDSYKNNEDNYTFPHFRGLATIRYDRRTISFYEPDKPNTKFKLWASIATVDGRVHVPVQGNVKHVEEIRNRQFLAVQLVYKNGDYYLHVIYKDNVKIPKEDEFKYFVGVDRGSHNNTATVVVQDRKGNIVKSKFYSAKPALEKRRRFYERKRVLGKKKLVKEIKKTKGKERNYINDQLHKISTDIIRIAAEYDNAVIVLEKLTGIRDNMKWSRRQNRKGHGWAFRKLENMLIYKAHGKGIAIRRVGPKGTSSTCRHCFGFVRRSPSIRAVCTSCKKAFNADWLGAVNITRRLFYYMSNSLGRSESGPEQHDYDLTVGSTASGVNKRLVVRPAASQC